MIRSILILLLAAVWGCTSPNTELASSSPITPAEIAGHYGQSGHIGFLELDASGAYECFIINGMTIDGCGTFEGAGISKGSWVLEGGSISFVPKSEPKDLVVKLSEASAVMTEAGLLLTIDGTEHFLPRNVFRTGLPDKPMQSDDPSGSR